MENCKCLLIRKVRMRTCRKKQRMKKGHKGVESTKEHVSFIDDSAFLTYIFHRHYRDHDHRVNCEGKWVKKENMRDEQQDNDEGDRKKLCYLPHAFSLSKSSPSIFFVFSSSLQISTFGFIIRYMCVFIRIHRVFLLFFSSCLLPLEMLSEFTRKFARRKRASLSCGACLFVARKGTSLVFPQDQAKCTEHRHTVASTTAVVAAALLFNF